LDIAPTVAAHLGVSLPNVDGVPIQALGGSNRPQKERRKAGAENRVVS
jgi:hypothetical protein